MDHPASTSAAQVAEAWIDNRVENGPECIRETELQVVLIAATQPPQAEQYFLGRDAPPRNRELIADAARRAFERERQSAREPHVHLTFELYPRERHVGDKRRVLNFRLQ